MKTDIDKSLDCYDCLSKADLTDWITDPQEQAAFYKMERLVERYAKKFFHLIEEDPGNIYQNLPIIFKTEDEIICTDMDEDGIAYGQFRESKWYKNNVAIKIVLPTHRKKAYLHKRLKATIRHEIIHYYLYLCGLPYNDNAGIFWAYCYIFDANAYVPMSEEDQEHYKRFVQICDSNSEMASYNDLQILAKAIMLDDKKSWEDWNMILKWKQQIKEDLENRT